MFQATNIRMAASVASGMELASGAATRITTSSVSACTIPATGLVAPLFTLVTVRAMVPVAGMPPNSGLAMLAMPWAISSWLGSWRSPTMPSATRAHSSDSMAPSSASVTAGISMWRALSQLRSGTVSAGSEAGTPPKRLPMVSTGRWNTATAVVARISATIEPGTLESLSPKGRIGPITGTFLAQRCQPTTMTSEPSATPSAHGLSVFRCVPSACRMPKNSPGILGMVRPRKSLICESAISTAMPLVKPMITATGMKRISVPRRNTPMASRISPDSVVARIRLATPYCWTMP